MSYPSPTKTNIRAVTRLLEVDVRKFKRILRKSSLDPEDASQLKKMMSQNLRLLSELKVFYDTETLDLTQVKLWLKIVSFVQNSHESLELDIHPTPQPERTLPSPAPPPQSTASTTGRPPAQAPGRAHPTPTPTRRQAAPTPVPRVDPSTMARPVKRDIEHTPKEAEPHKEAYRTDPSPQEAYRTDPSPQEAYRTDPSPQEAYRTDPSPQEAYRTDPSPQEAYQLEPVSGYATLHSDTGVNDTQMTRSRQSAPSSTQLPTSGAGDQMERAEDVQIHTDGLIHLEDDLLLDDNPIHKSMGDSQDLRPKDEVRYWQDRCSQLEGVAKDLTERLSAADTQQEHAAMALKKADEVLTTRLMQVSALMRQVRALEAAAAALARERDELLGVKHARSKLQDAEVLRLRSELEAVQRGELERLRQEEVTQRLSTGVESIGKVAPPVDPSSSIIRSLPAGSAAQHTQRPPRHSLDRGSRAPVSRSPAGSRPPAASTQPVEDRREAPNRKRRRDPSRSARGPSRQAGTSDRRSSSTATDSAESRRKRLSAARRARAGGRKQTAFRAFGVMRPPSLGS